MPARTFLWCTGLRLSVALTLTAVPLAAQSYTPLGAGARLGVLPERTGRVSSSELAAAPRDGFSYFDPANRSIAHHDGTGRLIRRFLVEPRPDGRLAMIAHGWYGDVLWVHDPRAATLTMFEGATGERTATFDESRNNLVQVEALTPRGAAVLRGSFPSTRVVGRPPQYGFAVSPGLGLSPEKPAVLIPPDACEPIRRTGQVRDPWCPRSLGVVSPSGEWLATVRPAEGTTAGRDAVWVTFHSLRGDTIAVAKVEAPVQERPLPRGAAGDSVRHLPVATSAFATRDGTVWLVQEGGTVNRYIVVSTTGAVIGRYSTPATVRLVAGTGLRVLGLRTRPNGEVEIVQIGL
ncbi:MAG: hypothetical protein KC544_08010 [Gemmatimonadetes bacterium]|nr:hypothetical protein [Gemmatimonadota bacterium]MCB9519195.1 hypothetical protein [Gemmatimonadales bacterium]HRY09969.1 hypothetical protein [Candidatus Nanopelagicales bacterium]